jgi:hypothetical protein
MAGEFGAAADRRSTSLVEMVLLLSILGQAGRQAGRQAVNGGCASGELPLNCR